MISIEAEQIRKCIVLSASSNFAFYPLPAIWEAIAKDEEILFDEVDADPASDFER